MTLYYCLYYNSGAEGAIWKGVETATPDVTCNIFGSDAYGSNESGQYGGGNAASAENPSGSCNVGIWANAHYQGGSNWLSPGWGGNRAWFLKNAEHSIAVADTWDCPGVGNRLTAYAPRALPPAAALSTGCGSCRNAAWALGRKTGMCRVCPVTSRKGRNEPRCQQQAFARNR